MQVIEPPNLLRLSGPGPAVLPPPAVILVQDIRAAGQPLHQHIDYVYFTRPTSPNVNYDAPIPAGPHGWVTREQLVSAFPLPAPDGTLVEIAEDARLLGIRAIDASE